MVETFAYDGTYGTITEHHKTEETYNPYCYTGREFDSKELYYYRARYYDPTIGRFISQDPIEFLAGDFNFYRYVGNDPVNWVDPLGLNKCKKLSDKLNKAKGRIKEKLAKLKNLKKLAAKKLAKKAFTLPLKAVPFLGWAMGAYDIYDTITTGMDIADLVDDFNKEADAIEKLVDRLARCKKEAAKDVNKGIEEYQRKQEGKTLQYKKCRVKLVPDPSGCYGHLGKGKCKAQSINCSDWNPE